MPSFLKDICPFTGTGEKNEDGLNLTDFLEEYDSDKYPNPSVTSDILVFQYDKDMNTVEKGLKLLMIQRKNHPSIGYWALPGGFVNIREDIDAAAKRELEEETGLTDIAIEQLYCWGQVERDPRTRIVTVSYLAMVEQGLSIKAGDDAADALWMDVTFLKDKDEKMERGRRLQNYYISLFNADKNITLSAEVERSENICGIIKEVNYQVISRDKIAFDHPSFIIQALLHIKSLL